MSDPKTDSRATDEESTAENAIEQAKRAFALRKYEQAVDHYATALEIQTTKYGDAAPENADLYFSYGRALLENAISQNQVLGKEQAEETSQDQAASTGTGGPILSFSGDAEDEAPQGEDVDVDIFAEASKADEEGEDEGEEDDDDDGNAEPEDDFNAAWDVLDLARALYDRAKDDDDEVKLKLADTYIALGDVSLETEKFDQAIDDYTAGLAIKTELLPLSSRQIAEAHYKLSMVLDLTSGRLADAIMHAERALENIEARLSEMRLALSGQLKAEPQEDDGGKAKSDLKGKGKASMGGRLKRDDDVRNMNRTQIESEIKDLGQLKDDLAEKVEELKTTPSEVAESAPTIAAKALDKVLATAATSTSAQTTVNDLTSMVKKKKVPDGNAVNGANGSTKRKADETASCDSEKKPRVEDD